MNNNDVSALNLEQMVVLKNKINELNNLYKDLIDSIKDTLLIDFQIINRELFDDINKKNINIESRLMILSKKIDDN